MRKQKKGTKEINQKLVNLIFNCPNGHEIKHRVEIVQSPGCSKILDSILFRLNCSECKWDGELLGSRRTGVESVGASERTR